jgi:hypothetical protein
MKLLTSILLFLVLGSSTFYAQDFYYGPKIGINVNHLTFSGNDAKEWQDNSKFMVSSHIGGFVEIVYSEFFSVQPELLYSIKGARFKDPAEDDYKSAYVLKNITLPIMFKYFVKEQVSLELGPQVSYLLSAKNIEVNGIFSSNLGSEAAGIDVHDEFNHLDIGIAAGVGYITKTGFYLGARYEYGLLDISESTEMWDNTLKNGTIMVSAGFSFN